MLLNALVALGLLSKSGDDYKNTHEARFFVQGSKDNPATVAAHANIWHRWSTLTDAVAQAPVFRASRKKNRMEAQLHAGMQRNAKDRAPLMVKALGASNSKVRRVSTWAELRRLFHCVRKGQS